VNKIKYIHTKKKPNKNYNYNRKFKCKFKYIEDYDNLPKHESIRPKNVQEFNFSTYLDFLTILNKYFKGKIGESFDNIYTDLIKKTKPKYRYFLDHSLTKILIDVCYYDSGIPKSKNRQKNYYYNNNGFYFTKNNLILEKFYLDEERKLRYFETKEELIEYTKIKIRQKKLERILNKYKK
jgi:hypothetical protein